MRDGEEKRGGGVSAQQAETGGGRRGLGGYSRGTTGQFHF